MMRTLTVGSIDTAIHTRQHADKVIRPEVEYCGILEWSQLDSVREAGRKAARGALESMPETFGKGSNVKP